MPSAVLAPTRSPVDHTAADAAALFIIYVDVTVPFEHHGIGCLQEDCLFINAPAPGQPPSQEDFHPNPAGYHVYADAISATLEKARQEQLA